MNEREWEKVTPAPAVSDEVKLCTAPLPCPGGMAPLNCEVQAVWGHATLPEFRCEVHARNMGLPGATGDLAGWYPLNQKEEVLNQGGANSGKSSRPAPAWLAGSLAKAMLLDQMRAMLPTMPCLKCGVVMKTSVLGENIGCQPCGLLFDVTRLLEELASHADDLEKGDYMKALVAPVKEPVKDWWCATCEKVGVEVAGQVCARCLVKQGVEVKRLPKTLEQMLAGQTPEVSQAIVTRGAVLKTIHPGVWAELLENEMIDAGVLTGEKWLVRSGVGMVCGENVREIVTLSEKNGCSFTPRGSLAQCSKPVVVEYSTDAEGVVARRCLEHFDRTDSRFEACRKKVFYAPDKERAKRPTHHMTIVGAGAIAGIQFVHGAGAAAYAAKEGKKVLESGFDEPAAPPQFIAGAMPGGGVAVVPNPEYHKAQELELAFHADAVLRCPECRNTALEPRDKIRGVDAWFCGKCRLTFTARIAKSTAGYQENEYRKVAPGELVDFDTQGRCNFLQGDSSVCGVRASFAHPDGRYRCEDHGGIVSADFAVGGSKWVCLEDLRHRATKTPLEQSWEEDSHIAGMKGTVDANIAMAGCAAGGAPIPPLSAEDSVTLKAVRDNCCTRMVEKPGGRQGPCGKAGFIRHPRRSQFRCNEHAMILWLEHGWAMLPEKEPAPSQEECAVTCAPIDFTNVPKPWGHELFTHLLHEHGLTCVQSELQEIVEVCRPLCGPTPVEKELNAVLCRNSDLMNPGTIKTWPAALEEFFADYRADIAAGEKLPDAEGVPAGVFWVAATAIGIALFLFTKLLGL